jgi:hypothetical protein
MPWRLVASFPWTRGTRSHGFQITFIFILILFIDSVNRVYRVQVELAATKEKGQKWVARDTPSVGCVMLLNGMQRGRHRWGGTHGGASPQVLLAT